MAGKPIEWRRFEPLELEEKAPVFIPSASDALPQQDFMSLLRAFERALRENERLRRECAELRNNAKAAEKRKTTSSGGNGERDFRAEERLQRSQAIIRELREKALEIQSESRDQGPGTRADMQVEGPETPADEETTNVIPAYGDDVKLRRIAEVAAAWLFASPNEQNVRLVEDALRGRGVDSLLNGGSPPGTRAE
jgi:hypothetical protein